MKNQKQPEKPTMEQEHENTVMMMLKWKRDYGAEVSLSAQMQVIAMQNEGKVKELKEQVESLIKKIDEMTEKAKDKKKDK